MTVLPEEHVAIGIEEGQGAVLVAGAHLGCTHFDDPVFLSDVELGCGDLFRVNQLGERLIIGRFQADPDGIVEQGLQDQRSVIGRDADFFL